MYGRRIGTLALFMLLMGAVACTPAAGPSSTAAAPSCSPAPRVDAAIQFLDALRREGVAVELRGPVQLKPLVGDGNLATVAPASYGAEPAEVWVFSYRDEATREADEAKIDALLQAGGFRDRPNFWSLGQLVVLYVGRDEEIISLLSRTLGESASAHISWATPRPTPTLVPLPPGGEPERRVTEDGTIVLMGTREVIPDALVVTMTASIYAGERQVVEVEGRFKRASGDLYLGLTDMGREHLRFGGLAGPDRVERIDGQWSSFHARIESPPYAQNPRIAEMDEGLIRFELRTRWTKLEGELEVPLSRPAGYPQTPRPTPIVERRVLEGGAINLTGQWEVVPSALVVTSTVSAYAHDQHIVLIEGRFRHTDGELYLGLTDADSRPLGSGLMVKPENVKRIDEDWSAFSGKVVSPIRQVNPRVANLDEGAILFELRKANTSIEGRHGIPLIGPNTGRNS